jgi:hypothetical protein
VRGGVPPPACLPGLSCSSDCQDLQDCPVICVVCHDGWLQGINAIKTGSLVSLSEQQLVDCDTEKDMVSGGRGKGGCAEVEDSSVDLICWLRAACSDVW